MDDFYTKKKCDRCGGDLAIRTMSRFNTDCICMKCAEDERKHPDYQKACDAERAAVLAGDRNYPGIGWPGINGRLK